MCDHFATFNCYSPCNSNIKPCKVLVTVSLQFCGATSVMYSTVLQLWTPTVQTTQAPNWVSLDDEHIRWSSLIPRPSHPSVCCLQLYQMLGWKVLGIYKANIGVLYIKYPFQKKNIAVWLHPHQLTNWSLLGSPPNLAYESKATSSITVHHCKSWGAQLHKPGPTHALNSIVDDKIWSVFY